MKKVRLALVFRLVLWVAVSLVFSISSYLVSNYVVTFRLTLNASILLASFLASIASVLFAFLGVISRPSTAGGNDLRLYRMRSALQYVLMAGVSGLVFSLITHGLSLATPLFTLLLSYVYITTLKSHKPMRIELVPTPFLLTVLTRGKEGVAQATGTTLKVSFSLFLLKLIAVFMPFVADYVDLNVVQVSRVVGVYALSLSFSHHLLLSLLAYPINFNSLRISLEELVNSLEGDCGGKGGGRSVRRWMGEVESLLREKRREIGEAGAPHPSSLSASNTARIIRESSAVVPFLPSLSPSPLSFSALLQRSYGVFDLNRAIRRGSVGGEEMRGEMWERLLFSHISLLLSCVVQVEGALTLLQGEKGEKKQGKEREKDRAEVGVVGTGVGAGVGVGGAPGEGERGGVYAEKREESLEVQLLQKYLLHTPLFQSSLSFLHNAGERAREWVRRRVGEVEETLLSLPPRGQVDTPSPKTLSLLSSLFPPFYSQTLCLSIESLSLLSSLSLREEKGETLFSIPALLFSLLLLDQALEECSEVLLQASSYPLLLKGGQRVRRQRGGESLPVLEEIKGVQYGVREGIGRVIRGFYDILPEDMWGGREGERFRRYRREVLST